MQKSKDPDQDLIADFVQMAGRYLAGGVDDPKFKPIVRWAIQNIPFLNEEIVEASAFNNWDTGQFLKAAMDKRGDEYHKRSIEKRIHDFIDITEGLSPEDYEQIRREHYRRKSPAGNLPDDLRTEINDILVHTQSKGAYLYISDEERKPPEERKLWRNT